MKKQKREILVITGNRSEYGLLAPVLREIVKSKKLSLKLLVTGSHTQKRHGHTIDLIRKDKFPIANVVSIPEGSDMLGALSKEIEGISKYCEKNRPDLMLVWGDRDEGFAGAIVAGHLRIPLAHVGGGDLSGYVVDEALRHSITKFAHVHFPISNQSARVIENLGEEKWRIHMTGTTAFDLLKKESLESRSVLAKRYHLDTKLPWSVFIQHPTPLDTTSLVEQIKPSLAALSKIKGEKIVIYPNSDTGADIFIRAIRGYAKKPNFSLHTSLPRKTYLSFLKEAEIIVGNSSSGIVEAGFFKKAVVDIGNRQKGREHGNNVLHAPYKEEKISQAIRHALSPAFKKKLALMKNPYGSGKAAQKIVKVLEQLRIDEKLMYKQISL